jgi:hypothetical protein
MDLKLGDSFETIVQAHVAIIRWLLDYGYSYGFYKSDSKRYIVDCRDETCDFKIRASRTYKDLRFVVTIIVQHTCSPAIHYKSRAKNGIRYLVDHHRAAVIDDRNITAG